MKLAAVIAAALTVATTAAAATAPDGFTETSRLEPAASYVAGKPAAVYCANTSGDWTVWIRNVYGDSVPIAYTPTIGGGESEFSPLICQVLLARLSHKPVTTYNLAASILILVHEAIHQRGIRDEGQTECQAIHLMPRVSVRYFAVKPGKQLRALMTQAWNAHRAKPAAFQTVC